MAFEKEQSFKYSLMAALLSALIWIVFFAGLAGCHNPLRGPRYFIESKAGSLGDGIVPNVYAVAATSTRVKAG